MGGLNLRARGQSVDATPTKKPLTTNRKWLGMEAAGIAPASREASAWASTCVSDCLVFDLGVPVGRAPFGLARHEFNSIRNRRLESSDPALSSPDVPSGRRPVAKPLLRIRQRDGESFETRQIKFSRLFTRPADQPRHATSHFGHPVDPGSPPLGEDHTQSIPPFRTIGSFFTIRQYAAKIKNDLPKNRDEATTSFSIATVNLDGSVPWRSPVSHPASLRPHACRASSCPWPC